MSNTRTTSDIIEHWGVKFRSGRFKYGSGKRPRQHDDTPATDRVRKTDALSKEQEYRQQYHNRDKMSTKAIEAKVRRIRAEQQFDELTTKYTKEHQKKVNDAIKEKSQKRIKRIGMAMAVGSAIPVENMMKTKSTDPRTQADMEMLRSAVAGVRPVVGAMGAALATSGDVSSLAGTVAAKKQKKSK